MRARALLAVRYGFLAVVLLAVGLALYRNWDAVADELAKLSWGTVLASGALLLLPPLFTLVGWRRLLADLGSPLAPPPAASVYLVGQLGKYLPGSVWSVVMQTEMGAVLKVPRRRMAVTGVLTLGFGVLAGALVAIPAVPLVLGASHTGIPAWWVFLGVAACLVVLYPPLLNTGIGAGLRMLRRPPLEHPLRWPVVAQIMVWLVLAWLAAGMATVVLMAPFVKDPYSPTVLVTGICGFAFGSVLGMLVVIAPAGVGVREAVLGLVLTTVMTPAAAGAVIVVARFLSIVVDILLAGGAWLWARRHHLLDRAPVEAG